MRETHPTAYLVSKQQYVVVDIVCAQVLDSDRLDIRVEVLAPQERVVCRPPLYLCSNCY